MNKKQIELLKTKPAIRAVTFDLSTIDEEKRTVEVAFSSDVEVERTFGIEVLDHSRGAVDLSLLNDGAPLLDGHDWDKQIGVVERAWIDGDGKGRAIVRFSKNPSANEIFQDVIDGIRTKISVGYWIEDAEMVGERDSGEPIYKMKWTPYEISFVSVPADNSVGVGRSLGQGQPEPVINPEPVTEPKSLEDEGTEATDAETEKPQQQPELETVEPEAERSNVDEIETNQPTETEEQEERSAPAIHTNQSKENKMDTPVIDTTPLQEQERSSGQRYSILKAVRSLAGDRSVDAGFEIEVSQELEKKDGQAARGLKIPTEALGRAYAQRDMNKGGTGANLVSLDHRDDLFIDVLREQTLAGRLGCRFLTGLEGDLHIPKQTSKGTFQWLDEAGAVSENDFNLGNVRMSPKTAAGSIAMTRRLMLQSSPSIERLVTDELLTGLAEIVDDAIFNGSGTSNQPTGILNQSGIQEVAVTTDGQPTFAETVEFITKLMEENARMGSMGYVMTPAVWQHLKTTSRDSGSGIMLMNDNDMMNGYQGYPTNKLPQHGLLFGNFSDVFVGTWSSIDMQVDPYTKGNSGGLVLRVFQDIDVAIRNAESFVKGA